MLVSRMNVLSILWTISKEKHYYSTTYDPKRWRHILNGGKYTETENYTKRMFYNSQLNEILLNPHAHTHIYRMYKSLII